MDNPATLAVVAVFFLAVLGAGVSVAYLMGKKGAQSVPAPDHRKLPEKYARELKQCLELSSSANRDAEELTAILASETPATPEQVASAVEKLITTARGLTDRVNQIGADANLLTPKGKSESESQTEGEQAGTTAVANGSVAPESDCLSKEVVAAALEAHKNEVLPASPFDDARQFKRSSFRGAVKATIYPSQPAAGREPVHCVVLTRDLSCGGIGIAHTDQLLPKQIVVLDAVGKLLVGEVRWCRREDENFYVAGCRLVKTHG